MPLDWRTYIAGLKKLTEEEQAEYVLIVYQSYRDGWVRGGFWGVIGGVVITLLGQWVGANLP